MCAVDYPYSSARAHVKGSATKTGRPFGNSEFVVEMENKLMFYALNASTSPEIPALNQEQIQFWLRKIDSCEYIMTARRDVYWHFLSTFLEKMSEHPDSGSSPE